MDRTLKARIAAVKGLLGTEVGSPSHATMSQVQSAALGLAIQRLLPLGPDILADIAEAVAPLRWHSPDHLLTVMQVLGGSSTAGPKSRRTQQVWTSVLQYGTQELWDDLLSPGSPSAKLTSILALCTSLGLRAPAEHSLKLLCSWWLLVTETPLELQRMDDNTKRMMLSHVKASFHAMRQRMSEPLVWLQSLPESPCALQRQWPVVFSAVYGEGGVPANPAIDIKALHAFDMTYGCRGGAAKLQRAASVNGFAAPMQTPSGMEAVASMLCQRMEGIASQQHRMLELAFGAQRQQPPPPQSLANLIQPAAGRVTLALPPLPAPVLEPLAGPAAEEEEEAAMPAAAVVVTPGAKKRASTGMEEMLGMLTERKKCRATAARDASRGATEDAEAATPGTTVANAAKKDGAKAEEKAAKSATVEKPETKAEKPGAKAGKPDTKSAKPGTTAAKPDTKAAKPGTKAGKLETKAAKLGTTAAKPKMETKAGKPEPKLGTKAAKPGTKATKKKGNDKVGCPKCRFSKGGCAQCRAPTYCGVW